MTDRNLEAGAASAIVNPPIGSYIAGDKRNRRFTGVHDDLHAKALVLHNGTESLAFLSVDCLGLTYPDIQRIRTKAQESLSPELGLSDERIVIGSTHIHNGPDIIGIYGPNEHTSGLDPEYMAFLIRSCAETLVAAAARRVPVEAWSARTEHGDTWVRNICEPEILDRSLGLLQFVDGQDRTVATLTNFACHPTILDGVHDVVSADWVGAFYRRMAERLGGEHLFFQGAIGAWIQPDKGDRSFAWADELGEGVAQAALEALSARKRLEGDQLEAERERLALPLANENWARLAAAGVIDRTLGKVVETEVTALRIGAARLVTHPGETPPGYALDARARMGADTPGFVLGLTQDAIGYLLPTAYFEADTAIPHARYLTTMSVGPEAGHMVLAACQRLLQAQE